MIDRSHVDPLKRSRQSGVARPRAVPQFHRSPLCQDELGQDLALQAARLPATALHGSEQPVRPPGTQALDRARASREMRRASERRGIPDPRILLGNREREPPPVAQDGRALEGPRVASKAAQLGAGGPVEDDPRVGPGYEQSTIAQFLQKGPGDLVRCLAAAAVDERQPIPNPGARRGSGG